MRSSDPDARDGVEALTGRAAAPPGRGLVLDRPAARRPTSPTSVRRAGLRCGSSKPETGRLLGTVDQGSAHGTVHTGAVYLHQGETYLVADLDLDENVAVARGRRPRTTPRRRARSPTSSSPGSRRDRRGARQQWWSAPYGSRTRWCRTCASGYPAARCSTSSRSTCPNAYWRPERVWWTLPPAVLAAAGLAHRDLPGAAHAAEHASIGLLPLFATCDRWDIGGVSTALHPDTGRLTVFVYDGHPGGAGFAERGYRTARMAHRHAGGHRGLRLPRRAARRACSRPSAATATTRSTRPGPSTLLDVLLSSAAQA